MLFKNDCLQDLITNFSLPLVVASAHFQGVLNTLRPLIRLINPRTQTQLTAAITIRNPRSESRTEPVGSRAVLSKPRGNGLGLSMRQLDEMLGVSATSMASLERTAIQGTAKIKTLPRALRAMGQDHKISAIPHAVNTAEISLRAKATRQARMIAIEDIETTDLKGQELTEAAQERLLRKVVAGETATL